MLIIVPSQVVLARTLSKKEMLMSVATKIAIQLNVKMGGEVWALEVPVCTRFGSYVSLSPAIFLFPSIILMLLTCVGAIVLLFDHLFVVIDSNTQS